MINLKEKEEKIIALAAEIFDKISRTHRHDDRSSGIWILVRIPINDSYIKFPIEKPAPQAQNSVVEKSLRTERSGHATSQNNGVGGCITFEIKDGGYLIHVSIAGVSVSEAVVMAIILMKEVTGCSIKEIMFDIKRRNGKLPDELRSKNNNRSRILQGYRE